MKKRELIIFILIIVFFIILLLFMRTRRNVLNNETDRASELIKSEYNEEEGVFEIYDENGELITTTESESDVEFYKNNPDFRESPPISPNNVEDSGNIDNEEIDVIQYNEE